MTPKNSPPVVAPVEERVGQDANRPHRVIAYIDDFNLYQGMRTGRLRHCYWLDVAALSAALLKRHQQLVRVRYFSASVVGGGDKARRQATYLDALGTLPLVTVRLGRYQSEQVRCDNCHANRTIPKEKQTDVAIATAMMLDAHTVACETLLLITGDSDLVPPIEAIRSHFPAQRVIVAFPPNRHTRELQQVAHGFTSINRNVLEASQLPDEVPKPNGHILKRPDKWKQ